MAVGSASPNKNENDQRITIDDAGEVSLPIIELLTGRGMILGKSGSGKSNSASVVAEQLLSNGFPLFIIDTDGEYWGLKEDFEILHVGADEECELQVGPEHAEKLSTLALEDNVPIILDVSGYLDEDEKTDLIREVARHLFAKEKKLKKPFLLLVEEVHEYIPEGGGLDAAGQMLVKIAKRGRKHGLGITGISQRPANVKKDFLTQCDWVVWHRLTWDNDTKVVGRVLGRDYADAVEDLADGEAFLFTDWTDDIRRVQWRRKETFDAGATPGLDDVSRPELKGVSEDLVAELESISDRTARRQDRIEELEARLEAKEEEIEDLQADLDRAQDISDMSQQVVDAFTGATDTEASAAVDEKLEELREDKNATIRELREERDALESQVADLEATVEEQAERIQTLRETRVEPENWEQVEEAATRLAEAVGVDGGEDPELRRRLQNKEDRIDNLEATIEQLRAEGHSLDAEFSEKMDFLNADPVVGAIETAAGKVEMKAERTWDVLSVLVDQDEASTQTISKYVDISEGSIRKILRKLRSHNVVTQRKDGNTPLYSLNTDGMKDLIQQQRKREEISELRERVHQ